MTSDLLLSEGAGPRRVLTRRASGTAFEVHLDVFEGPFDLCSA